MCIKVLIELESCPKEFTEQILWDQLFSIASGKKTFGRSAILTMCLEKLDLKWFPKL